MSGLAPVLGALRDAEARRLGVVREAAQVWTDSVFRVLDGRVLEPIAVEARRFLAELDSADAELARVHRLLDQH